MIMQLQELKVAALAATPGPWGIGRAGDMIVSNQSHPVATVSDAFHRQLANGDVGKDAEFIAAANPDAILTLLGELEASQCALKNVTELWNDQRQRISWINSVMSMTLTTCSLHRARSLSRSANMLWSIYACACWSRVSFTTPTDSREATSSTRILTAHGGRSRNKWPGVVTPYLRHLQRR